MMPGVIAMLRRPEAGDADALLEVDRLISLVDADSARSLRVAECFGERPERDVVLASGMRAQLWTT